MEMSNGTTGSDIIVTTTATASPKYKGLLLQAGKKKEGKIKAGRFQHDTPRHRDHYLSGPSGEIQSLELVQPQFNGEEMAFNQEITSRRHPILVLALFFLAVPWLRR